MKGKKINFQTLFNIFVVITISVLLYFHFRKKESFEGIAGSSFVSRVPKGTIVAFNGTTAPAGWALCNGENGTPDLKSKFILGYESGANNIGDTGGEKEVTLTPDKMPSHSHSIGVSYGDSGGCNIGLFSKDTLACARLGKINDRQTSDDERGNGPMNYINTSGGDNPHNNMPPFYVLAYIIKL